MTTDSVPAGDDPGRLLADARHLAHRVRLHQRVTWFPLLVLAAVTFAAIPVARYGPREGGCRAVAPGLTMCEVYLKGLVVYWPLALTLAYVAIAAGYLRVARARGVGTRVRPYVLTGIALAVLLTALSVWNRMHPPTMDFHEPWYAPLGRLVEPAGAIGVALLVLAGLERHLALLLFALGYLLIALVLVYVGGRPDWAPLWGPLPQLSIDGAVLLVGGLGFLLVQRRGRHR